MPINSNNLIIKKDNIVEKPVFPAAEKKVLKIQGKNFLDANKYVQKEQPKEKKVFKLQNNNFLKIIESKKEKIIEKPVESYYLKKRELAKQNEFIRVNGSKKDWTKSDYFVDMLSKEY